jgi:hypothetical protein
MAHIEQGKWNDYSEEIKPKLRKGETAIFQVIGAYNPVTKTGSLKSAVGIPSTDRIYDSKKDEWIDIALVRRVNVKGEVELEDIYFVAENNNAIVLHGGRARDQARYEFFTLCNYNASNPNRDASVTPLIQRIDKVKDAMEGRKKLGRKFEAIEIAKGMSDQQVKNYFIKMGSPLQGEDVEVQRFAIEQMAEKTPEKILSASGTTKLDEIFATLTQCEKHKLIKFNEEQSAWLGEDDGLILKVHRGYSKRPLDKFVEWVLEDKKGKKMYEDLKVRL